MKEIKVKLTFAEKLRSGSAKRCKATDIGT